MRKTIMLLLTCSMAPPASRTMMKHIALLLPWTLMAGCNPSGPTPAELFDLRTKCIAMTKAGADEFAHNDATRNRCFTAHVENYLGP